MSPLVRLRSYYVARHSVVGVMTAARLTNACTEIIIIQYLVQERERDIYLTRYCLRNLTKSDYILIKL